MSVDFHPHIRRALDDLEDRELRECLAEFLETHHQPALRADIVDEERHPLEVAWWERLIGRSGDDPELPRMGSKYGGLPYLEDADEWPSTSDGRRDRFVGQIDFADAETPAHLPGRGILAVYAPPAEPAADEDPFECFRTRWYPGPAPHRAAPPGDFCPTLPFEAPIELARADSYRLPTTWGEVVPGPVADRQDLELDDQLEEVNVAIWESSGHVGAACDFGLDGPGPRHWQTDPPDDVDAWFELWRPYPVEVRGDLIHSLVIPERGLRSGELEGGWTLSWQ